MSTEELQKSKRDADTISSESTGEAMELQMVFFMLTRHSWHESTELLCCRGKGKRADHCMHLT